MALDLGIFLEGAQSTFKVKVSENDQQAQYLLDKLFSSDGSVTITETNNGGVETIDLTTSGGGGISSPLTTKGDLFTYSTTDARLGDGTDGQALIADSAEATGLKWGTISADNFATADLTLTGDRAHDLNGNKLTLKTSSSTTGYLGIRNSETTSGVEVLKIWGDIAPRNANLLNEQAKIYIGAYNDPDQFELGSLYAYHRSRVLILPTGTTGDAHFQIRGATASVSSTKLFLVEANTSQEAFRITNDRQTYTKRLNVTGLGSTSATTSLLVQNSSSSEAFKILDDLAIIMANLPTSSAGLATGQLWNNSGVVNIA